MLLMVALRKLTKQLTVVLGRSSVWLMVDPNHLPSLPARLQLLPVEQGTTV